MKKITQNVARILYNKGEAVYLQPSEMALDCFWCKPCPFDNTDGQTFDQLVNSFLYYNCGPETGMNIHFYINGACHVS